MSHPRTIILGALCALSLTACQNDTASAPQKDGSNISAVDTAGDPGWTKTTGGQDVIHRDYALADFTGIDHMSAEEVKVRQGPTFAVRAKGGAQDVAGLILRVDGGKLIIERKAGSSGQAADIGRLQIDVVMPLLSAVTLRGSGDVDAEVMSGDVVSGEIRGSGDLSVKRVTAKNATFTVTGSGDLDVDGGELETGDYRISGTGDVDVEKLRARDVGISISGTGDVSAFASGRANVNLMGTGDVKVKGGATCQTKKLGTGSVTCS